MLIEFDRNDPETILKTLPVPNKDETNESVKQADSQRNNNDNDATGKEVERNNNENSTNGTINNRLIVLYRK